jgi:hypothetical protein
VLLEVFLDVALSDEDWLLQIVSEPVDAPSLLDPCYIFIVIGIERELHYHVLTRDKMALTH